MCDCKVVVSIIFVLTFCSFPPAAPTVQLMFSSRVNKSKAEKSRGQILQAFESVLSSAIILEIRYESKNGGEGVEGTHSNIALTRSFTKHSSVSSGSENLVSRLQKGRVAQGTSSNQTRWMQSDPHILTEGEIIEVGPSQMEWYGEPDTGAVATDKRSVWEAALSSQDQENIGPRGETNVNTEHARQKNIVRGKVSLAHVINKVEACSQQGGWSRQKGMSITEKLEQENL